MKQIRNTIRYIVIIILDIIVMVVFHSYINFILLVGLIIFPIYSIVGVYMARDNLTLRIETPVEPMGKGEEFEVRYILRNESWFPIVNVNLNLMFSNSFYDKTGEHTLNIPVRAKKETKVTYPIVMEYCGRFQVEVAEITLLDVLGVCLVKLPIHETAECLVFPKGHNRNKEAGYIYMRGVTEAMESKEKGYDFSDISGIREYIPGDKLQDIHWKLSVKKDELMVKERVSVSAMQLNVLVDFVNNDDMCAEGVLELADSITKAFVLQNLPFTIYYYSTNMGELKSTYIGNEIERTQWMEMVLYDVCYGENVAVEDMFIHRSQAAGSYLYIGQARDNESGEDAIYGDKNTVAVLKMQG